ncbi:MAG: Cys-tRNA(Pro) deacylase [Desulfuromonadales bacterium]
MAKTKIPVTPATRLLRQLKIDYTPHLYPYQEHGGTAVSARELAVAEHSVIKTLVMEDDQHRPLLVLMHGDREVSTKELARILGVKSVAPCTPEVANKHTGYRVGGTSPFATQKELPVYLEETILDLDRIYLNGGKRGFLIAIAPRVLIEHLKPTPVNVAISR